MSNQIGVLTIFTMLMSCRESVQNNEPIPAKLPVQGTWKLLTATLIEKNDTVVTDYTKGKEFIKIIGS